MKIDPLNDNILDPEVFKLYKKKRVKRFETYLKRRDKSFDFMNIG